MSPRTPYWLTPNQIAEVSKAMSNLNVKDATVESIIFECSIASTRSENSHIKGAQLSAALGFTEENVPVRLSDEEKDLILTNITNVKIREALS